MSHHKDRHHQVSGEESPLQVYKTDYVRHVAKKVSNTLRMKKYHTLPGQLTKALFGNTANNSKPHSTENNKTGLGSRVQMRHQSTFSSSISKLSDEEVVELYTSKIEDLIEKDSLRVELRQKSVDEMRNFLRLYNRDGEKEHCKKPNEFVETLNSLRDTDDAINELLKRLLISCKNEGLSWIKQFNENDLMTLAKRFCQLVDQTKEFSLVGAFHQQHHNLPTMIICMRIVHAIVNTGYGFNTVCNNLKLLKSISFLITTVLYLINRNRTLFNKQQIDSEDNQQNNNHDIRRVQRTALQLLIVFTHKQADVILAALTELGKFKHVHRFEFLVTGVQLSDTETQNHYLMFTEALFRGRKFDVDYRVHLRSELTKLGFFKLLYKASDEGNEKTKQIVSSIRESADEDFEAMSEKFDTISFTFDDPDSLFKYLMASIEGTSATSYFVSSLQYLLLIRDEVEVRNSYFALLNDMTSHIVMSRKASDPDFRDSLETHLQSLHEFVRKGSLTTQGSISSGTDDLKSLNSIATQPSIVDDRLSRDVVASSLVAKDAAIKPDDTNENDLKPGTGVPSPPPPPPPPPLMLPGHKPSAVGAGGPPLPPPLMFQRTQCTLPSHIKPKKPFKIAGPMKKLAWNKVSISSIKEHSVWTNYDEEKYEQANFLDMLAKQFRSHAAHHTASTRDEHLMEAKHEVIFHVIDGKDGQNLAIMMSYLKANPETIHQWIRDCEVERIPLTALEQIMRCLSSDELLLSLKKLENIYGQLQDPEKLLCLLSKEERLRQRINCIIFLLKFTELFNEAQYIMASCAKACRKIRKSEEFRTLIETILTIGNYMNSGMKNYECAHAFDVCVLPKLVEVKSAANGKNLLHFILDTLSKIFKVEIHQFFQIIFPYCEKLSRVDIEELKKTVIEICRGADMITGEVLKFSGNETTHKFTSTLKQFLADSTAKVDEIKKLETSMISEYEYLADYFTFQPSKYPVGQFFSDMCTFITQVKQCSSEIEAKRKEADRRRVQERNMKIAEDRRNHLKMRQERFLPGDEDENVVDKLMEALREADNENKPRKRLSKKRVGAVPLALLSDETGAMHYRELSRR